MRRKQRLEQEAKEKIKNIETSEDASKNIKVSEQKDLRSTNRERQRQLNERKQQMVNILNSMGERTSYLNAERRLLGSLFYLDLNADSRLMFTSLVQTIKKEDFYSTLDAEIFDIATKQYERVVNDVAKYDSDNEEKVPDEILYQTPVTIEYIDNTINSLSAKKTDIKEEYKELNEIIYLSELLERISTSKNLSDYALQVKSNSNRRQLIDKALDFANTFEINEDVDKEKDSEKEFSELTKMYNQIANENSSGGLIQLKEVIGDFLIQVQKMMNMEDDNQSIHIGKFNNLDKTLTGFRRGNLIILGARPAVGKTAFVQNLMYQVLYNGYDKRTKPEDKPVVAMFSLEMNDMEILERFAAMTTEIPGSDIRQGQINDEQFKELNVFANNFTSRFYIDADPTRSVGQIEEETTKIKNERGRLDLIVIDYLQLLHGSTGNRQQEIADISRGLKTLAKRLNVPIIALAQLSRTVEQRTDKTPVLSDLRESGQIEQDADVVMFLHRDDYYDTSDDNEEQDNQEDDSASQVDCIIAKNRAGQRGTIKYYFEKNISRFSELSFDEVNDTPNEQSEINKMKQNY